MDPRTATRLRASRRGVRRARRAALPVLGAVLLSGCLGPNEHDPTGTAPVGRLDFATGDGASVRVVGWALDPDTHRAVQVKVMVDGGAVRSHTAALTRSDVGAAHPRHGPRHGFDVRTPALSPGTHQVCVWIPNVGRGTRDRLLGCPEVVTGHDDVVGEFESLTQLEGPRVRARGFAYDPDATGPSALAVTVDGAARPPRTAPSARPDLNWIVRKDGDFGFSIDLDVEHGTRTVCITAVDRGRGSDARLGCRDVHVNETPVVGAGEGLSSAERVGPPEGHPLELIDRDAGISTQLRDGSVLWLFGDSSEGYPEYRYFANNTAAWAAPDAPATTLDAVSPDGHPYTFATPVEPFAEDCPVGFDPVMWPMSATNVPDGDSARDRVIAFFGNVCLFGSQATGRGVSVVEWIHDPAAPSAGSRIEGTVLAQNLFPAGQLYGNASTIVQDPPGAEGTFVYGYRCGVPDESRLGIVWPDDPQYSSCTVGRVPVERVHDRAEWEFWTGGHDWSDEVDDAEPMEMPGRPSGDKQLPVSNFTVVDDPHLGLLMAYSPWPGYTHAVLARQGASPTGPWSAADAIQLPGCRDWANGGERWCYAGTAQPWRSSPGQLGLGYYDQYAAMAPDRGSYIAGSAPFPG